MQLYLFVGADPSAPLGPDSDWSWIGDGPGAEAVLAARWKVPATWLVVVPEREGDRLRVVEVACPERQLSARVLILS
jgi:hypothetical protein